MRKAAENVIPVDTVNVELTTLLEYYHLTSRNLSELTQEGIYDYPDY